MSHSLFLTFSTTSVKYLVSISSLIVNKLDLIVVTFKAAISSTYQFIGVRDQTNKTNKVGL